MKTICVGEKKVCNVADEFVDTFCNKRKGEALVVCLNGDLGVGKTTFTKCVAKTLGVLEVITSPTFVIEKIYNLPEKSTFDRLIHIDAYRISKCEELDVLGWSDMLKDSSNLIFIEWPVNIKDRIPNNALNIYFEHIDESSRDIQW